jgi:hypothetical protein
MAYNESRKEMHTTVRPEVVFRNWSQIGAERFHAPGKRCQAKRRTFLTDNMGRSIAARHDVSGTKLMMPSYF